MTTEQKWALGGLGAGLVVGGLLTYALMSSEQAGEDDRPPIIVRGGSINFEVEAATRTHPPTWEEDPPFWKLTQPNGRPVASATATVQGAPPNCNNLSGRVFFFTYQENDETNEFVLVASGPEPRVLPTAQMTASGGRLTYGVNGQGRITRMRVPPSRNPCVFPPNSNPEIKLTFSY